MDYFLLQIHVFPFEVLKLSCAYAGVDEGKPYRSVLWLAVLEELKTLPYGAVWDYYCLSQDVPIGPAWVGEIKRYEKDVLALR